MKIAIYLYMEIEKENSLNYSTKMIYINLPL